MVKKLDTADYSLLGGESYIGIERKGLGDLIGCVTKERPRFERMLVRMDQEIESKHLIVEANLSGIYNGDYVSRVSPLSVVGSMASWAMDYGICCWFADSHSNASRLALRILMAADRRLTRADKEGQQRNP